MNTHHLNRTNSRWLWWITAGGFLAFFVFGFIDNLKGPTLPILLQDMQLSYTQGGTILFSAYIGFLIATLATGVLADVAGNKSVLILAGLCIGAGLALFSAANQFGFLVGAMALIGVGMGAIEVGGNALIVDVHTRNRGRYLNLLAVFHGIGSLIVPIYAAQLLQQNISWQNVFRFTIPLAGLLILYFIFVPYPKNRLAKKEATESVDEEGIRWRELGRSGFSGRMRWYYLLIAVYVAAELGMGAWLVTFLQETKDFTVGHSALYLSLFFAAIVAGRLLGSFVVERIGYLRIMLAAIALAMVCLILGIFGPSSLALFLPITGFFFSIVFPTTTAAVSELHSENTGTILGLLFAFGGLGGALGPWAIGVTSDWLGLQAGLGLVIGYCVLVAAALIVLMRE